MTSRITSRILFIAALFLLMIGCSTKSPPPQPQESSALMKDLGEEVPMLRISIEEIQLSRRDGWSCDVVLQADRGPVTISHFLLVGQLRRFEFVDSNGAIWMFSRPPGPESPGPPVTDRIIVPGHQEVRLRVGARHGGLVRMDGAQMRYPKELAYSRVGSLRDIHYSSSGTTKVRRE
jgi:hypothetical protein